MARNGSGVYSLPAANYPAVSGTLITAANRNAVDADIATALTGSLAAMLIVELEPAVDIVQPAKYERNTVLTKVTISLISAFFFLFESDTSAIAT